jgi:hypothetical protein
VTGSTGGVLVMEGDDNISENRKTCRTPSSGMLCHVVLTRATQCNIPEDGILHSHRRENFISYIGKRVFVFKCSNFNRFLCAVYQGEENVCSYLNVQTSTDSSVLHYNLLFATLNVFCLAQIILNKVAALYSGPRLNMLLLWVDTEYLHNKCPLGMGEISNRSVPSQALLSAYEPIKTL